MKAISLWQPWASLVALGHKKYETRSWPTRFRGPILIHAAKKWSTQLERLCLDHPFAQVVPSVLPRGCLLATATLVECVEITASTTPGCLMERAFGDYTPGRFRWEFVDVKELAHPIAFRGFQGIFEVDLSTHQIERLAVP